jgi:hypothetical protein
MNICVLGRRQGTSDYQAMAMNTIHTGAAAYLLPPMFN